MADRIKIINCPKGGKVPEGYCLNSCLNYRGKIERNSKENEQPLRKTRRLGRCETRKLGH
jgi:hypothetical protein